MALSITNLAPTTELEAVNAMLSAIGEAPITDVTAGIAALSDVAMAVNLLRNVTRETQAMGWRFNTEFGYQLIKTADSPFNWNDTTPLTTPLNIFLPPANLLGFATTQTSEQAQLDLIVRISRKYTVTALPVLVFYDRALNRDGLVAATFPYLYIDPVWGFDFEQMPEEARQFCFIKAARKLIQHVVGSQTLSAFTEQDERVAYRNLKREFGANDIYNMNTSVAGAFGCRPVYLRQRIDIRKSPGPT